MSEQTTAKVVSLNGAPIPNTADPEIVEALEQLLEQARRGEITAIGYVVVRPAATMTGWIAEGMHKFSLHSGAALLLHRVSTKIDAIGFDTGD